MESILVFGTYFLLCIAQIQKSDNAFIYYNDTRKKRIVIYLALITILLGALRNMNTGIDTINYMKNFSIWRVGIPISYYWEELTSDFFSEQGFYILERAFYNIIPNTQLWMAFLCIIFIIPCMILIYRYSDCPPVSFIYITALFIYTFVWQGLRQTVAMSICLMGFMVLLKKRDLKNIVLFVLIVLLASQFHRSSLVFLLAIPALYMKANRWHFVVIGVVFCITLITPYVINETLLKYFNFFDKVEDYASGNASHYTYTMFYILLMIYVACYYLKSDLINESPENEIFFNLSLIGLVFQAMATVIAEMFRASYYFNIFNMLLLANASQLAWRKYPKLHFRFMAIAFMVFIFFACGGFDYWFAWESRWSF